MITVNASCINLIKRYEGLKLKAYLCPAGVPTIGFGTIKYPPNINGGRKVKIGDEISQGVAIACLMHDIEQKANAIDPMLREDLTPNQFAALISFAYNLGEGALRSSTLLKKVNKDPNDPSIVDEFLKWSKARVDGKLTVLKGLLKRRKEESTLYFTK